MGFNGTNELQKKYLDKAGRSWLKCINLFSNEPTIVDHSNDGNCC